MNGESFKCLRSSDHEGDPQGGSRFEFAMEVSEYDAAANDRIVLLNTTVGLIVTGDCPRRTRRYVYSGHRMCSWFGPP